MGSKTQRKRFNDLWMVFCVAYHLFLFIWTTSWWRGPVDPGQIPSALASSSHVFLRVDSVKRPLTPPYDGPFRVIDRSSKTFTIWKNEKTVVVSIDKVKPAFVFNDLPSAPCVSPALSDHNLDESRARPSVLAGPTRSGRLVRPPDRLRL